MSRHLSIKSITLAVFLAASTNLVWQFYQFHRERIERERVESQNADDHFTITYCRFGPSRDEISRLYVEFFLMVAYLGSWAKGFRNTVLTVFGLAGATIFYVLWWQYYFRLAEISESELTFVRHLAYLYRANYLDLCIAGLIGLLIVLHIRSAMLSVFQEVIEVEAR